MDDSKRLKLKEKEEAANPGAIFFASPGKTQQHQGDEQNINTIIARAKARTHLPPINPLQPKFGDFTGPQDLQDQLDRIIEVKNQFGELPARVRERFANDPVKLLEFIEDPENLEEGLQLGIFEDITPPAEPASPAPAVDPAGASSESPPADSPSPPSSQGESTP